MNVLHSSLSDKSRLYSESAMSENFFKRFAFEFVANVCNNIALFIPLIQSNTSQSEYMNIPQSIPPINGVGFLAAFR